MHDVLSTNNKRPKLHMTPTKSSDLLNWDRINTALNWKLKDPIRFLVEREGKILL